jgi:hypothetical protein
MSNIFNYEIDERNLRIQLRSMEVPMKEEAWQKFEAFSAGHPFKTQKTKMINLQLHMSRNVVLPVVFAIVICFFSVLLFNFISIKKARVENIKQPDTQKVLQPSVVPAFESIRPVRGVSQAKQPETSDSVNTQIPEQVSAENQTQTPLQNENAIASLPPVEQTQVQHKRRRNNTEEQLSEIKPTLISDEAESNEVVEVPN